MCIVGGLGERQLLDESDAVCIFIPLSALEDHVALQDPEKRNKAIGCGSQPPG